MRLLRPLALALACALPALGTHAEGTAAAGTSAANVSIGLRLLFVAVDRNADGRIESGEADLFLDNLFAQADSDGDGRLSVGEVVGLQARFAPGEEAGRQIRAQFRQMDHDRDGFVDGREVNKAAVGHFAFLDADHDGAITLADLAGRDLVAPGGLAAKP